MHYLSQRISFWIAVLSVVAFVMGNMMGQHGWRVFWKSVLGEQNDSLIVYSGTVPPVERIPDFHQWSLYGEGSRSFSDVPAGTLIALPRYNGEQQDQLFYSIGYMGSYATGLEGQGSHPGVDIRLPVGTPVQAVMNGIVTRVDEDNGGFGTYVVLRHPNVPDPSNTSQLTTLYSVYAHLSVANVSEGEVVQKGQQIALSGQSGLASGPHLHFQIERDKDANGAPVPHPFWTFTTAEARAAGLSFSQAIDRGLNQQRGYGATVNPLLYVQAQYAPVLVAEQEETVQTARKTPGQIRAERIQNRIVRRRTEDAVAAERTILVQSDETTSPVPPVASSSSSSSSAASSVAAPVAAPPSRDYVGIEIRNPRSFSGREWVTVEILLKDVTGDVAVFAQPTQDIYLRTAYGRAEFRPSVLTARDFRNGKAQVEMLPLGRTTVVVELQPGSVLGGPMTYRE